MDWINDSISPNLERLVLSCIDADFCNQIVIFQHFSRSTKFTYFCTAQNSKIQQKTRHNFGKIELNWIIIHSNILNFCIKIAISLLNLDEKIRNFADVLKNIQIRWKCRKKCKILRNFGAKSGIVAVIHSCRLNNSIWRP